MVDGVHWASRPRASRLVIELDCQFERLIKRSPIAGESLLLESGKGCLLGRNEFGFTGLTELHGQLQCVFQVGLEIGHALFAPGKSGDHSTGCR